MKVALQILPIILKQSHVLPVVHTGKCKRRFGGTS